SYLLSEHDRNRLKERIAAHRSKGRLSVVGFYRSHTRKDFAITTEDADLFSAHFAKSSNVFLLIQMDSSGAGRGGFLIWEGRTIRSKAPYLSFPLDPSALMRGGYEIRRRPSSVPLGSKEVAGGTPAADSVINRTPVFAEDSSFYIGTRGIWAGTAAVVLAAGVLVAAILHGHGEPIKPSEALALRVAQDG